MNCDSCNACLTCNPGITCECGRKIPQEALLVQMANLHLYVAIGIAQGLVSVVRVAVSVADLDLARAAALEGFHVMELGFKTKSVDKSSLGSFALQMATLEENPEKGREWYHLSLALAQPVSFEFEQSRLRLELGRAGPMTLGKPVRPPQPLVNCEVCLPDEAVEGCGCACKQSQMCTECIVKFHESRPFTEVVNCPTCKTSVAPGVRVKCAENLRSRIWSKLSDIAKLIEWFEWSLSGAGHVRLACDVAALLLDLLYARALYYASGNEDVANCALRMGEYFDTLDCPVEARECNETAMRRSLDPAILHEAERRLNPHRRSARLAQTRSIPLRKTVKKAGHAK